MTSLLAQALFIYSQCKFRLSYIYSCKWGIHKCIC